MAFNVRRTPLGVFLYGVAADRPAAAPEYEGAVYVATDADRWSVQLGGAWRSTASGSSDSVGGLEEMQGAVTGTAGSNDISFVHSAGDTLFDYTTPSQPKPLEAGVYAITAWFTLGGGSLGDGDIQVFLLTTYRSLFNTLTQSGFLYRDAAGTYLLSDGMSLTASFATTDYFTLTETSVGGGESGTAQVWAQRLD